MTYAECAADFIRLFFKSECEDILKRMSSKFAVIRKQVAFTTESTNPLDKKLDFIAYLISFCLVMESRGMDRYDIREFSLSMADYISEHQSGWNFWLRKKGMSQLNTPFAEKLRPVVDRKIGRLQHADGFKGETVSDLGETHGLGFGINIHSCGICPLLEKTETQRFAHFFCEVDRILLTLPGFKVKVNDTIMDGANHCDIRFKAV